MNGLTPLEENILTGARDNGMVPFPQGAARAVEQTFKVLENLARRGYLRFVQNGNWYQAYWLTEKGRRLARAVRSFHRRSLSRTACQMS